MEKLVYGCYSIEAEVRKKSSSGGVFYLLAKNILSQNGVVFGTALTSDCRRAEVIKCSSLQELHRILGAKYLQSRIGDAFIKVREELEAGKLVLFSGTPCQINGLKRFLAIDYDRLFCVDIFCHGVPSPKCWNKYLNWFEKKYNVQTIDVNFRFKEMDKCSSKISKEGDKFVFKEHKNDNPYMLMFLRDYNLRPSCYECKAKEYHLADISLGDFWGVESEVPELKSSEGVSIVICRTEKGRSLFEGISDSITSKQFSYDLIKKYNPAEFRSAVRPTNRRDFFKEMNSLPYGKFMKRYPAGYLKRRIKSRIRMIEKKNSYTNHDYFLKISAIKNSN